MRRRHLEDGHAPGAEQPRAADLSDHAGHLTLAQLGNAARVQTVFIAKRQIVEQVFDRVQALGRQQVGQARTDSLQVLHRGGEFCHREVQDEL